MKFRARAVVGGVLLALCLALVIWMFLDGEVGNNLVGKANIVGGLAGVASLGVTVWITWPLVTGGRAAAPTDQQVAAALRYLAGNSLAYWQDQAKTRRITTPAPASVRWAWAGAEIAAHPGDVPSALLTDGTVTQIREKLYEAADSPARLVILAGAGAGKTTAMLLLLIDVLTNWSPDRADPVPVWITLGGWDPSVSDLPAWVTAKLTRDQPLLTPGLAGELVRDRRVALFLDGLDEMPTHLRGEALDAIDRGTVGMRVVLTSRDDEYVDAAVRHNHRLWNAAVIEMLPVGLEQARGFLLAQHVGEQRRRWQRLADSLTAQTVAGRTLVSPLALSLARDTYRDTDPAEMLDARAYPTPESLLQHLLERSLHQAYPEACEREHAMRWLSWIAANMGRDRDLLWWRIPGWEAPMLRWAALRVAAAGFAGLVVVSIAGPEDIVLAVPTLAWLAGFRFRPRSLTVIAGIAVSAGLGSWSVEQGLLMAAGFLSTIPLMWLTGVLATLLDRISWRLINRRRTAHSFDDEGLRAASATAANPIDIYRLSWRRAQITRLAHAVAVGLTVGVFVVLAVNPIIGLLWALGAGFLSWLLSALLRPQSMVARLRRVELCWCLAGLPVRIMPLLETALQRQVLRQAGGIYQFRHAALQDQLAGTPPDGEASTGAPLSAWSWMRRHP
ncbi:hypothetical protein SAMN05421748_10885 [Paractinoplanes atraurantiacus]|uniref:NACHT domain-containing protein n=2 Tax=Paractinoplanes atraurantiacus TaxID=1036182 RepID=A0A285IGU8_9ACTN|nr:hypothetical protein SAMN05421748_10885 [Actinoplanes atraurantiacus]